MVDQPYRYTPPRPSQALAFLVSGGYRAYQCGDPGEGRVIVWARTCYDEQGFPDFGGTMQRIARHINDCTEVARLRLDVRLLGLIHESLLFVEDDSYVFRLRRLRLARG